MANMPFNNNATTRTPTTSNTTSIYNYDYISHDAIYNYDYISHDANGNQRSSEAIKGLEAFYLLFNPTTFSNDVHLSSTKQIDAPVVEAPASTHLSDQVAESTPNPSQDHGSPKATTNLGRDVANTGDPKAAHLLQSTTAHPYKRSTKKKMHDSKQRRGAKPHSALPYFDLIEPPPKQPGRSNNEERRCSSSRQHAPANHEELAMTMPPSTPSVNSTHQKDSHSSINTTYQKDSHPTIHCSGGAPKLNKRGFILSNRLEVLCTRTNNTSAAGTLSYFDLKEPPPMALSPAWKKPKCGSSCSLRSC